MSSQKFIARNRAPRVQIEYDVELYGAEKKVQLPFVMGVLSDLAGNPAEPLPPVAERKFLEISVDNFDERLKALKPRVTMQVPNTLTGDGKLNVELTFESLNDFSPGAVAEEDSRAAKAARGTHPAGQSDYVHGRQGGRRRAHWQNSEGPRPARDARGASQEPETTEPAKAGE